RFWNVMSQGDRCRIRLCCGTSNRTRILPGSSSSPKPGTQPDFTRSAVSSAIVGRNGTDGFEVMSGVFFAEKHFRFGIVLTGLVAARLFTGTRNGRPNKALIL